MLSAAPINASFSLFLFLASALNVILRHCGFKDIFVLLIARIQMIKAVIVVNTSGKVRLCQFYEKQNMSIDMQQRLIKLLHTTIASRGDTLCHFLDGFGEWPSPDTRVVYRRYATLCIIFITDSTESCLAILDLIQVFVEVLDRIFKNVCELDFMFHSEKIHRALMEIVTGGMVLEMSKDAIVRNLTEMDRMASDSEKKDSQDSRGFLGSANRGTSATMGTSNSRVSRERAEGGSSSSTNPFTLALDILWARK